MGAHIARSKSRRRQIYLQNLKNIQMEKQNIIDLDAFTQRKQREVKFLARSETQKQYIKYLEDFSRTLVIAIGPAGVGKSLIASQYAIKAYRAGLFEKIVITRPIVCADEEYGFLPGNLIDKLSPWSIPILDIFKEYYHPRDVEKMLDNEIIEIAPLGLMRGRTLKNSIVIADEVQNTTVSQFKMLLTRVGDGTRMVATGDLSQTERGFEKNGLQDFIGRLRESRTISLVEFSTDDVVRHPLVSEVLDLYSTDQASTT